MADTEIIFSYKFVAPLVDCFKCFRVRCLHKNIQLLLEFLKTRSIRGPTLFFIYIEDLSDDVICNIASYADNTTLYFQSDQASDLWQQLERAVELDSDLQYTVDWCRKWPVDFNSGKTQLVLFDQSNNTGAVCVIIDGSVLEEKSSFKMVGLPFSSNLDWGSYINSVAKTASKKLEPWFILWRFFLLRSLCFSINLPYGVASSTIVMSGQILLKC